METNEQDIDFFVVNGIYEKCNRLKDGIDLFEHQILDKLSGKSQAGMDISTHFHGLRGKERLRIFLTGEFSSGKTTFTKRLIDDLSGPIAGGPETASLVVHCQANQPSLTVFFRNAGIVHSEKFERFLNKYGLMRYFEDRQGTWTPLDPDKTFEWSTPRVLDFLADANGFPEVFDKIQWNHRKSGRFKDKNTLMDFADLYDMPGSGGKTEHGAVIESVFKNNEPDAILYLIDTNRGTPSEEESKALKELLRYIITEYNQRPLFYWVYQKPSTDGMDSGSFIDEKRKGFEDFINELETGNEKIEKFPSEYCSYLKRASILDARGPKDDTELAQKAVSFILKDYYSIFGKSYIDYVRKFLNTGNQQMVQFGALTYNYDTSVSGTDFIKTIISEIRANQSLSTTDAIKIFHERLCLNQDITASDYPHDLQSTLSSWKKHIFSLINEIIGFIEFKEKKSSFKITEFKLTDFNEIFGGGAETGKISADKIDHEFWDKYNGNAKWQELLYRVQAYHWLNISYSAGISAHYSDQFGTAVLKKIGSDIKSLEELRIEKPVVGKLEAG